MGNWSGMAPAGAASVPPPATDNMAGFSAKGNYPSR